jgi:hypothetical protein
VQIVPLVGDDKILALKGPILSSAGTPCPVLPVIHRKAETDHLTFSKEARTLVRLIF